MPQRILSSLLAQADLDTAGLSRETRASLDAGLSASVGVQFHGVRPPGSKPDPTSPGLKAAICLMCGHVRTHVLVPGAVLARCRDGSQASQPLIESLAGAFGTFRRVGRLWDVRGHRTSWFAITVASSGNQMPRSTTLVTFRSRWLIGGGQSVDAKRSCWSGTRIRCSSGRRPISHPDN